MNRPLPIIHDCFTYNGENDLLWLRLETLRDIVHRVVIAEATRTFTGKPKALKFDITQFRGHADRIHYLVVDDLNPHPSSPWDNEFLQRNALARGLFEGAGQSVSDDHWILLSDVDEIPCPDAVLKFRPERYISALMLQRNYFYAFNNQETSNEPSKTRWRKARITTVGQVHKWFATMQNLRTFKSTGALRSLKRYWNRLNTQYIDDAGWHFSYLMTPEQIIEKLKAFSHQEVNIPEISNLEHIRACMAERRDLFGKNKFTVVPIDDSFPQALIQNRKRFAHLIW